MAGIKEPYNVYQVTTYYYNNGVIDKRKEFVGKTWAVSPQQAICNVQFRHYGKAIYGGGWNCDTGMDESLDVTWEAIPKWKDEGVNG